jgi:hypothetical protein
LLESWWQPHRAGSRAAGAGRRIPSSPASGRQQGVPASQRDGSGGAVTCLTAPLRVRLPGSPPSAWRVRVPDGNVRKPRGPFGPTSDTHSDRDLSAASTRTRRSERPGLPRRSPAEPLRSRPFCTHTPWLLRPQASTAGGLSHGLTAARLEPSVKTGCCRGPLPPGAAEEPEGVRLGSRIGHLCGNLHRAGLRSRDTEAHELISAHPSTIRPRALPRACSGQSRNRPAGRTGPECGVPRPQGHDDRLRVVHRI